MEGFGARDALGDPKKFGYVTMEIGPKELAKCEWARLSFLRSLSRAGLRIGEAKPDFRERIARINSLPPRPVRPKQNHARNHGYPSPNLPPSPLSATVAASTPGWVVTPSGRTVRPMRMRRERPLEPICSALIKPPSIKARRRTIDPTKWDSVYLKGVFLDSVPVALSTLVSATIPSATEEDEKISNEDESEDDGHSTSVAPSRSVCHETNTALALLGNIFGEGEDWGGSEGVDEMEGGSVAVRRVEENAFRGDEEDEIEVVPRDYGNDGWALGKVRGMQRKVESDESGEDEDARTPDTDVEMADANPPATSTSFSLLGHLDLEGDILGIGAPNPGPSHKDGPRSEPSSSELQSAHLSLPTATTKLLSRPFTCSAEDTTESIRVQWECDKITLTHEWKRAWREARGGSRRRGGAGGGVGDLAAKACMVFYPFQFSVFCTALVYI
ncbi:hypothetical protein HYDPIDRAFT_167067 [Hydnomerulius pinastri MD-312]|nr:hypothetical protein HYDPIDRAFT_167067 [Hydnomerulius pinastri MD-312]